MDENINKLFKTPKQKYTEGLVNYLLIKEEDLTETEKEIQKALDNLVLGRTTIAIAHRLSTLRRADRLVVLDRGQVVEVGDHDTLMGLEGAYFRLYQAQVRQDEDEVEPKLWRTQAQEETGV